MKEYTVSRFWCPICGDYHGSLGFDKNYPKAFIDIENWMCGKADFDFNDTED